MPWEEKMLAEKLVRGKTRSQFARGGVAKIKGTGKTRRKGAHDGLTSFSVHKNLVPPFTILSMTCQFMVPQQ